MRGIVLVVDDVELNRIILREILQDDYDLYEAENGQEALDIMNSDKKLPDVVLLDIIMPVLDGYGTIEKMKSSSHLKEIPVLFITAAEVSENEQKALSAGAMDFISKPFDFDVVRTRVQNHVQLSNYRQNLESMVEQKTKELNNMYTKVLDTLATIIEYRDLESGVHIKRTGGLSEILIKQMLTNPKYENVLIREKYNSMIKAVALHDIGKVGIPDSILLKNGRLTDEEFTIMKTHSSIGGNIINAISKDLKDDNSQYLRHCKDICMSHHERWDGKGYPVGLKGEDIPLSARIVSIIDVFDALINKRCYKEAYSYEDTVKIILDGKGTQFDPDIIEEFVKVTDDFYKLTMELQDEQEK